jgi:hypothetical protein
MAVDLTIDAILDARGGKAQQDLLQIFRHFNDLGFYWGAAFPTETLHSEASDDLIRRSQTEGEVARDARDLPRVAYFSGLADRSGAAGSIDVFVAMRIRPSLCLLGGATDQAEAQRITTAGIRRRSG